MPLLFSSMLFIQVPILVLFFRRPFWVSLSLIFSLTGIASLSSLPANSSPLDDWSEVTIIVLTTSASALSLKLCRQLDTWFCTIFTLLLVSHFDQSCFPVEESVNPLTSSSLLISSHVECLAIQVSVCEGATGADSWRAKFLWKQQKRKDNRLYWGNKTSSHLTWFQWYFYMTSSFQWNANQWKTRNRNALLKVMNRKERRGKGDSTHAKYPRDERNQEKSHEDSGWRSGKDGKWHDCLNSWQTLVYLWKDYETKYSLFFFWSEGIRAAVSCLASSTSG